MPTDSFGPPINGEVYINGNMEGHPQRLPDNLAPPAPTGTASPAPMAPMAPTTSTQPASSATLAAASAQ